MTASLLRRRLTQNSEQPSRKELAIALLGLSAIIVAILAGEVTERVRDTETNSTAPYSRVVRSHNV